jgi:hypothetical protein
MFQKVISGDFGNLSEVSTMKKETLVEAKERALRSLGCTSLGLAIGYAGNLVGINWLFLVTGIGAGLVVLVLVNLILFFMKKRVSWEDSFNLLILLGGVLPTVTKDAAWSSRWVIAFMFLGVGCMCASILPSIRGKEWSNERSRMAIKKGSSNKRLKLKKLFALTLIIGIILTGVGYHLLTWADNSYYAPQSSSLQGRVSFYFLPAPVPGEHPMMLNVAFSPLVGRTNTSHLNLSVAGNFPGSTPWISFLFETTFHFVGQSVNSSSGNGAGNWREFDWHTSTGQPETLIQFLYNNTNPATDRLSFNADISMNFTGLPFLYEHGRYTILIPFNPNGAGYTIDNGFLTVFLPEGTFFSTSNEPQQVAMPVGAGSGEYIQSRLNQSSVVVITYDDSATEKAYSDKQTWGLFSLGVGVPSIISSFPLYQHGKKSDRATDIDRSSERSTKKSD